ncbi:outer membrane protein assembly factor BamB [Wenzhouxiangella sediminis]|uniref:outer membrane protein assembly factor BamB n=1 Tax=Wenzhouxiangella sediminis TaxID=1792836 RepID=UPI0015F27537|nr:outer membrane protein assembly factor BamB [Wenzhouxiangella sediminis]
MTRQGRLFLLVPALLALAGCQTIGGWFGGGSDEPEPAELTEISQPVPIDRVWSVDTGEGTNRSQPRIRPVYTDGQVWVADHEGLITAVDAETGRVQREIDIELPISAGPTVTPDLVIVGTFDGELVVIDRESGRIQWRAQLSSEILAKPVLHDGIVVARCIDGRVFGLDRSDGARIWVHDRSVPLLTLRGNGDPLPRAGQVYIGYDDGQVTAIRVSDGSVLWEQRVSAPEGRTELDRLADIDGPMLVVGTELYVVTYHGRLAGLALESGRTLWVKDISSSSGLSLRRTQLAVTDSEDNVWLVDRRNGATLWRDDQLLRRELTRPVFLGGLVAVGDFEGYLHFFDADSGQIVGRARAGDDAPAAAPLVVGDTLYLLDEGGRLSAWRVGRSG